MPLDMDEMLRRRVCTITNPSMKYNEKVRYAGNELICMGIVADMWGITQEEVFLIIERIEAADEIEMFEPERSLLSDNQKIFWDWVHEMEPYDLSEIGI